MLLKEMFSAIGAPDDDDADVNWLDDLKFHIDNNNDTLEDHLFPAIKQHKECVGKPGAYKLYIKPILINLDSYCKKFEIENREEKFPKSAIIELAKHIAAQQETFIARGDYDSK